MFDYETLKLIWWALVVVIIIGFALMDGFDMGVAMLLPFVGKTDDERRVAINVVGPTWEGNQVWLVLAGGAVFAAWPLVYAAGFSMFYFALILTLCALFLRPVGFDYRSKLPNQAWRNFWDWALFFGGIVPAIVFGVAIGNLFVGLPFKFDDTMHVSYQGGLVEQLNPFAVYCGVVSALMLALHGGCLLVLRTDAAVAKRSRGFVMALGILLAGLFVGGGFWLQHLPGLNIQTAQNINQTLNPLDKQVMQQIGGWLANYSRFSWLWALPTLGIASALFASIFAWRNWGWASFGASSLSIIGIISTAALSLFPFILPSNIDLNSSLTAWDGVSSHKTLWIMLIVTLIFLPIVVFYTAWVYRVLRGTITVKKIQEENKTAY